MSKPTHSSGIYIIYYIFTPNYLVDLFILILCSLFISLEERNILLNTISTIIILKINIFA